MEFILAEDFLKQDENVHVVFLNWWKPSSGDLFQYRKLFNVVDYCSGTTIQPFYNSYAVFKKDCIPLFTEGQLRKFIEDKTAMGTVNVDYFEGYRIKINISINQSKYYKDLGNDLLQAYWNVAVEIAKESLKNNKINTWHLIK